MGYQHLTNLIKEDNVITLTKILNSNELQQNFNILHSRTQQPLLLFAVQMQSIKVVEYLLSQDFVDKNICNFSNRENIYHIVCSIRWMRAEQLFFLIESKVSHLLLLNNTNYKMNAFQIACYENATLFIVKRVYEIMKNLQVDLIHFTRGAMDYTLRYKDVELVKFVSLIDGLKIRDDKILDSIVYTKFEIVQLIFSIKGFQAEKANRDGLNVFLFAIDKMANIKIIKYIYKLFPSLIHSQRILKNGEVQNAASLVVNILWMKKSNRLKILIFFI